MAIRIALARAEPERVIREIGPPPVGSGRSGEYFALYLSASLGQWEEIEADRKWFQEVAEKALGRYPKRQRRKLEGRLAMIAGDFEKTREELERADALLAGTEASGSGTEHVPIWFWLAQTHIELANDESARELLLKVVGSDLERASWPPLRAQLLSSRPDTRAKR